ncbi:MAG: hypothetical protein Q8M83_00660 [bacterium]|nr:hypothetical protein [bacterium]
MKTMFLTGLVCLLATAGICACGDETSSSWDIGSYTADANVNAQDGGNTTEDGGTRDGEVTTDAGVAGDTSSIVDSGQLDTEISDTETPDAGPTWYDSASDLTWQINPEPLDLSTAQIYCMELGNKWHLPTIGELRTLIRGCAITEKDGPCGVTDSCLTETCKYGCEPLGISEICPSHQGPNKGFYWPDEIEGDCGGVLVVLNFGHCRRSKRLSHPAAHTAGFG